MLAKHGRIKAVEPQCLGDGGRAARHFRPVAGKPCRQIGHDAITHRMMIAPG